MKIDTSKLNLHTLNESIKALCNDLVKNQFSVKLPVNLDIKGEK